MTEAFRTRSRRIVSAVAVAATILGFTGTSTAQQKANKVTDASMESNAALLKQLPFADKARALSPPRLGTPPG